MADPIVSVPGLRIERAPRTAQYVLHCDEDDAPRVGERIGIALPSSILTSNPAEGDGWRALRLGPDEWLLIGQADATLDSNSAQDAHSLVDIGSRNLGLNLSGTSAAELLAAGCPLDLCDDVFPAGSCTRTLFGKVQIVLERGPKCFRMQYPRSFDGYVIELIQTAALDLRAEARVREK